MTNANVTPLAGLPAIRGHCPMGCGTTLVLASGTVFCTHPDCPRRSSVHDMLSEDETQHVVVFDDAEFTIKHPLRERMNDGLFRCELHRYLAAQDGPPLADGRYRAGRSANGWAFEPVTTP